MDMVNVASLFFDFKVLFRIKFSCAKVRNYTHICKSANDLSTISVNFSTKIFSVPAIQTQRSPRNVGLLSKRERGKIEHLAALDREDLEPMAILLFFIILRLFKITQMGDMRAC